MKPYFELDRVLQRRRLLRGAQALRPDVQGAARHPRLSAGRARLRGVRRRRQVVRALLCGLLQARQQERRRVDGHASSTSRACSGTHPVVFNVCNFTKPAPGQPALLSVRRRDARCSTSSGTRCTACSSNVKYPHARGHERAARLRRVPVAVQRALGERADGVRELRQALPDRRADAGGARRRRSRRRASTTRASRRPSTWPRRCSTWRGTRSRTARPRRTSTSSRPRRCTGSASTSRSSRRGTGRPTSRTSGRAATRPATTRTSGARCSTHDAFQWFVENGGMTRAERRSASAT